MHRHVAIAFALLAMLAFAEDRGVAETAESGLLEKARTTFEGDADQRGTALDFFAERGNADAAAALILARRFIDDPRIDDALAAITGETDRKSWSDWMLWQEAHEDITPFHGFDVLHSEIHARIDPNFQLFLRGGNDHEIRIEEIVWGGVRKDGIPALTNPRLVVPDAADYLNDDDLVFGVAINGDARAYPLRILDWHEMFNDSIGGVPVSLAYCTLCGSGILYEPRSTVTRSHLFLALPDFSIGQTS